MITPYEGISFVQGVTAQTEQNRRQRKTAEREQGDTVSFSDEAYAALEASRKQTTASATGAAAVSSAHAPRVETNASLPTSENEYSLSAKGSLGEQLRKYLENPILMHALEQMDEAIEQMGLSPEAADVVREQVEAVFRSGIPAEGEQTTDAMNVLRTKLKKYAGLEEEQIGDLMGKIGAIVEDAQKKEERAGKENRDTNVILEEGGGSAQQARAVSRGSGKERIETPLLGWADVIYPPQYSSGYLSSNKILAEAAKLEQQSHRVDEQL